MICQLAMKKAQRSADKSIEYKHWNRTRHYLAII